MPCTTPSMHAGTGWSVSDGRDETVRVPSSRDGCVSGLSALLFAICLLFTAQAYAQKTEQTAEASFVLEKCSWIVRFAIVRVDVNSTVDLRADEKIRELLSQGRTFSV